MVLLLGVLVGVSVGVLVGVSVGVLVGVLVGVSVGFSVFGMGRFGRLDQNDDSLLDLVVGRDLGSEVF